MVMIMIMVMDMVMDIVSISILNQSMENFSSVKTSLAPAKKIVLHKIKSWGLFADFDFVWLLIVA